MTLAIPAQAIDLECLNKLLQLLKEPKQDKVKPTCPPVKIVADTTPTPAPIKDSRLNKLGLSAANLRAIMPKNMNNKMEVAAVAKAQGLARFLLHHGTSSDATKFVVTVHHLLSSKSVKIDWAQWFCSSDSHQCPPLWWRVVMLVPRSKAPYYLQLTQQAPALDVRGWDTAAVLYLLQTNLFSDSINQAAGEALEGFRHHISHYSVDMRFGESFECIATLLPSLGQESDRSELAQFHTQVRSFFPAFDTSAQMQQARERPLMLTARQYHEFRKRLQIKFEGEILSRCRLRFQCGASSGKTVMATILCAEFAYNYSCGDERSFFLTHAPIMARRAATDLRDQLTLKLCYSTLVSAHQSKDVQIQGPVKSDDPCVYQIRINGREAIVVATINAALDSLMGQVFLAGVVVDEAHAVYGSDRRKGQTIGQCRLPAKRIAPIIEAWGGACDASDGANQLR